MSAADSRSGVFPADTSLINAEFIRRLQDQRALHRREAAFHLAQVDKHGAADEALENMIQAAEKIVAIMLPAVAGGADAPVEAAAEDMGGRTDGTEAAMGGVGQAAGPLTHPEVPTPHGEEDLMSDIRTGTGGNSWRARLLGSHS
jgi:hypothetical protein